MQLETFHSFHFHSNAEKIFSFTNVLAEQNYKTQGQTVWKCLAFQLVHLHFHFLLNEWMNEWMMHLYSAFFFIVYCHTPKALYNHVGGHSSTTTSVQHPLGWCDGSHRTTAPVRSPHTSYRWRGEREIEPIKLMGIIRRPWLTRASGGNLARTPGLHPYLFIVDMSEL